MKNLALMTVFNTIMMILNSGLLFWSTLYCCREKCYYATTLWWTGIHSRQEVALSLLITQQYRTEIVWISQINCNVYCCIVIIRNLYSVIMPLGGYRGHNSRSY